MSCNRRLQARIPSLVAGELGAARSWLLRRHIETCPACRAQAKRTQDLLSGLATLAMAPTTDALRARVFDQIAAMPVPMSSPVESDDALEAPASSGQSVSALRAVWTVSRRSLMPLIALLMVVVAGTATTGYLLGRLESRPMKERSAPNWSWYSDLSGRTWYLSGNFNGVLRLESGDRVITTWQSHAGAGSGQGELQVTVNRRTYRIRGTGTHEIREPDGTLLGRLRLEAGSGSDIKHIEGTGLVKSRTRSEQARIDAEEIQYALQSVGKSEGSVTGTGEHVGQIDTGRGLIRYKIHGDCTLQLTTPTRRTNHTYPLLLETVSTTPLQRMTAAPSRSRPAGVSRTTPLDVEVSFEGHTLRARRYGKYSLTVDHFNTVLIVEISPVGSATPWR